MTTNLEEKSEILNDLYKKGTYVELKSINLHDYFLKITPSITIYLQNFQKTFTP